MIEEIFSLLGKDVFTAETLANGTVRIHATLVDDYRKTVAGVRKKIPAKKYQILQNGERIQSCYPKFTRFTQPK